VIVLKAAPALVQVVHVVGVGAVAEANLQIVARKRGNLTVTMIEDTPAEARLAVIEADREVVLAVDRHLLETDVVTRFSLLILLNIRFG